MKPARGIRERNELNYFKISGKIHTLMRILQETSLTNPGFVSRLRPQTSVSHAKLYASPVFAFFTSPQNRFRIDVS